MMNIVQVQDNLKDLSDQQLLQTMQTGSAPQYLVLAEMQRRKKNRQESAQRQQQPQGTVAEEIMSGVAALPAPAMQGMASGGIVGFQAGGLTSQDQLRQAQQNQLRQMTLARLRAQLGRQGYAPDVQRKITDQMQTATPDQIETIIGQITDQQRRQEESVLPDGNIGFGNAAREWSKSFLPPEVDSELKEKYAPRIYDARLRGDKAEEAGAEFAAAVEGTARTIPEMGSKAADWARETIGPPLKGGLDTLESFTRGVLPNWKPGSFAAAAEESIAAGQPEAPTSPAPPKDSLPIPPAPAPGDFPTPSSPAPGDEQRARRNVYEDEPAPEPSAPAPKPSAPAAPTQEGILQALPEDVKAAAEDNPGLFSPEFLLELGLGMMAAGSQPGSTFASAVGAGGLQALKGAAERRKSAAEREKERMLEEGRMERARMEQAGALQRANITADIYRQQQQDISRARSLQREIDRRSDDVHKIGVLAAYAKAAQEQDRSLSDKEARAKAAQRYEAEMQALQMEYYRLLNVPGSPSSLPGMMPGAAPSVFDMEPM